MMRRRFLLLPGVGDDRRFSLVLLLLLLQTPDFNVIDGARCAVTVFASSRSAAAFLRFYSRQSLEAMILAAASTAATMIQRRLRRTIRLRSTGRRIGRCIDVVFNLETGVFEGWILQSW